ncbi:dihydrofolate reductase [Arthrobacter stackebrandtii]|uniref:Dihydrofolate reductase n=1 Tax=Arthrobacter stackebrandtii TaxID=272161 RepID=A0ABS4YW79_9MICC|nr:dihydrofolate reductase family protein [Arthrobacter stackebrandtii]MBP2412984.1 dihydrofolate reductase [Arthrobacter stackebrandtii]PYH01229.1 deaminase [Arthrobacter stackebrandtii]
MTRTVFYTASTLNGYLADEGHSLDWLFAVPGAEGPDIAAFMDTMGVFVEGSSTYEWVLRHENLLAEPAKWQQFYGNKPTYVFTSRTLPVPEGADVRFVNGPVADVLAEIRAAAGELDVWVVGGGELAGQFLDLGALDELVVTFAPATVAGGAPLLPRTVGADRLTLRSAEQHGQFAMLTYDVGPVAGAAGADSAGARLGNAGQ